MPGKPATDSTPGSGGQREGAGRPFVRFIARRGGIYIMERETIGGAIRPPERWTVLRVNRDEIEFQSGDDIIVLRLPDSD